MTTSPRSLTDWLAYAEGVHSVGIDLGLARVAAVAARMGFEAPHFKPARDVVIVAGTNGKGSTSVAIEALLMSAGLRVGTTLSPHVHAFNERVRLDGVDLDDETLCVAFAAVDEARGDVPLTYFEFAALVALHCFRGAVVDVAVLEVGLGGRLDAFNLVSADVAVITSIGLDHEAWLGSDLETIGREKAGVMRPGQRVVAGADVTASVVAAAAALECTFTRLGEAFHVYETPSGWDYRGSAGTLVGVPAGPLAPCNGALALEAAAYFVEPDAHRWRSALAAVHLPGRFEIVALGEPDGRPLVLDVAHNPAGAAFLNDRLARVFPGHGFVAVVGMLADKDCAGVARALGQRVRAWVCVPTAGARGQSATELARRIRGVAPADVPVVAVSDVAQGLDQALSLCEAGDGILAFGSFALAEQVRGALGRAPMDRGI